MSEEENIKVYQPWSAPLLHISLNPRPLRQLIRITDTISRDPNRISYNDKLAGEIENEWQIPTSTFNFHSFKSYIKSLSWKYFETLTSQYHIENDEIPESLVIFKTNITEIKLISSWFNDQVDNEYNPMHNHTGILSGVLYLKIPEYLPSRKTKDTDGSISFIGNESKTDGVMTNSTITISPKVGDLFLFPSSLKHQVYPFRTTDGTGIRRSLSFNMG
jgi:uncharacterized protein (TIGR02466 family)